jgi:hypothetical protein
MFWAHFFSNEFATDFPLFTFFTISFNRYHDVVLNDNTANTNRFKMPLSSFVGVDNEGHSMILANALVSSEDTEAYEWILDQLLKHHQYSLWMRIWVWRLPVPHD